MYELKVIPERRQGYGNLRQITDARQVYEAFREEFEQLDRDHPAILPGRPQKTGRSPSASARSAILSVSGPRRRRYRRRAVQFLRGAAPTLVSTSQQ